ncbi:hypothetical protein BH10BAC5_BH10BAC5_22570 [soil metagenome]
MFKELFIKLFNQLRETMPLQVINFFLLVSDTEFLFRSAKSRYRNASLLKKIIIVRTDALGDYVMWQNYLRAIRAFYSAAEYELILLGNSLWTPLAEETGMFKKVIPIDRKRFIKNLEYRSDFINDIRSEHFDILINPVYARDFAVNDSVCRFIRAKRKITLKRDKKAETFIWNMISNKWYSEQVKTEKGFQHELIRSNAMLKHLEIPALPITLPVLINKTSLTFIHKNYFICFPGAGAKRRQWESAKMCEVIQKIFSETDLICYVCGSAGESHLAKMIIDSCSDAAERIIDQTGKTDINSLTEMISQAQFCIGNETGTIHLAGSLNIPSVAIVGGGHFERFMPYPVEVKGSKPIAVFKEMDCFYCSWRCRYVADKNKIVPCISNVTVDIAWKNIKPLLEKDLKLEKAN